jgi:hypothetical protein
MPHDPVRVAEVRSWISKATVCLQIASSWSNANPSAC